MDADAPSGLSAEVPAHFWAPLGIGTRLLAERSVDYRRAFYAFSVILVGTFLLMAMHGTPAQTFCGHDAIGFLAMAWKVRCGQFPHADFNTAPGALNSWIHAAGMWLLGPTAAVLPYCSAFVGIVVGMLAWCVAQRRLPAAFSALFATTISWLAMSPHLIRFEWYYTTFDGYYNHQSFALLCVLMLQLLLPARRTAGMEKGELADDFIAGSIFGALLFIKVSYFLAGCGLGAMAFGFGSRFGRRIPWRIAAGFVVFFALCLPLIRFDLAGMFADLRMAAGARAAIPEIKLTFGNYARWFTDAWVEILLLAAIHLLLRSPFLLRRRLGESVERGGSPSWAELGGLIAINMFICTANSPAGLHSESPLLACWAFVLMGSAADDGGYRRLLSAAPLGAGVLSCALWFFTFTPDVACLYWTYSPWPTKSQRETATYCPPFESDSLADLPILSQSNEAPMPTTYAGKVNDGLSLLRKLGGIHRVADLDFVNPFPFALQWPAARGDLWCWDRGFSFSETSHPSPKETFGDADILMIPKYPAGSAFELQERLYGNFIRANFRAAGESACWYMLRRR